MSISTLLPREQQIWDAALNGDCRKEIAKKLGISVHTVRYHFQMIYAKLGLSSYENVRIKLAIIQHRDYNGATFASGEMQKLIDKERLAA